MQLTQSQSTAVAVVHQKVEEAKKLVSLSGPAGSGKTTIIDAIVSDLFDSVTCTPTNKAAQVLVSKGIPAQTFFKTFFLLEERKQRGVKPKFISCRRYLEDYANFKNEGGSWQDYQHILPEGKRAFAEQILLDEGSMVSSRQLRDMSKMCNSIILVGDKHQLPPVGDPDYPAGLFASITHDVELTEVLRQAEGSMILQAATEIRNNTSKVERALRYFEPQDSFDSWVQRGAKVICFTNKERQRINTVVRRILGFTKPTPMEGDQVICCNNYSDDLINGTEGRVVNFEWDGNAPTALVTLDTGMAQITCRMNMHYFIDDQVASQANKLYDLGSLQPLPDDMECADLTFSYCITAHKAQGSEWPAVVVIDQRGLVRKVASNDTNSGMSPDEYVRRWTYTAITRARQELALAPNWWAALPNKSFEMEGV